MLSAVRRKTDLSVNGRTVTVKGGRVTISVHSLPVMTMSFDLGYIRVMNGVKVSRKSSKVLNAVLETYTDFHIRALGGVWLLERDGKSIPVGDGVLVVPMSKEAAPSELEKYIV